jgi:hypothetical protein
VNFAAVAVTSNLGGGLDCLHKHQQGRSGIRRPEGDTLYSFPWTALPSYVHPASPLMPTALPVSPCPMRSMVVSSRTGDGGRGPGGGGGAGTVGNNTWQQRRGTKMHPPWGFLHPATKPWTSLTKPTAQSPRGGSLKGTKTPSTCFVCSLDTSTSSATTPPPTPGFPACPTAAAAGARLLQPQACRMGAALAEPGPSRARATTICLVKLTMPTA